MLAQRRAALPPSRRGARGQRIERGRPLAVVALHKGWAATGSTDPAAAAAGPRGASKRRAPILEPDAATTEMLTILRDPRSIAALAPFLPAPLDQNAAAPPVLVADVPVLEQGPLAGAAAYVDAAARRALPGHLLRRSRILSSLRVGGECLQRVAVTACSGEELVLSWRLQHTPLEEGNSNSSGGSSSEGDESTAEEASSATDRADSGAQASSSSSRPAAEEAAGPIATAWRLVSIRRDGSGDEEGLPLRPHPRVPPERTVLALLAALRRGAMHEAAQFSVWGRHASSGGWDAQMQEFRALLRAPDLHLCLTHDLVELGPGALPVGQRSFLQEVTLVQRGGGAAPERRARLLFLVNMHADGCWLVRDFKVR